MTKVFMHKLSEQSLNLNGTGFYNGKNFRTYRYASILLWRAECAVEDGQLDLARTYVNLIRNRAKTSTPVMGLCLSTKKESCRKLSWIIPGDWGKAGSGWLVRPL
jgi:hypothetical protein